MAFCEPDFAPDSCVSHEAEVMESFSKKAITYYKHAEINQKKKQTTFLSFVKYVNLGLSAEAHLQVSSFSACTPLPLMGPKTFNSGVRRYSLYTSEEDRTQWKDFGNDIG